jgi:hypothetical protein
MQGRGKGCKRDAKEVKNLRNETNKKIGRNKL